jgi:hypothetical protein
MTTVFRKISLKHPEIGQAGGICRFQDASAPESYHERHKGRWSARGLTGGTALCFSVKSERSLLTMASAAPGQIRTSTSMVVS